LGEEGLEIRRALGEPWPIANMLDRLAVVALAEGAMAQARAWLEESLQLWRAMAHRRRIAWTLSHLGAVALASGTSEAAEAPGVPQASKPSQRTAPLAQLAIARSHLVESLTLVQGRAGTDDFWQRSTALALDGGAALAAIDGRTTTGRRLAGAAAALRERLGPLRERHFDFPREALLAQWPAPAREVFSEGPGTPAWNEGQAMSLEQAIAYALEGAPAHA
jgi:hypothetical protein